MTPRFEQDAWSCQRRALEEGPDAYKLALERTSLAYERTLMAWIRTAMSLITFGFTVYKFFQFESWVAGPPLQQVVGPREFAIIMISIGLVSLVMALMQHMRSRAILSTQYPEMPRSVASWAAALTTLLGVAALAAVALRI
jgi:putative membrane protein